MSELEKTGGGSLGEERTVETVTFEIKALQRQAAQMAISYAIQIGMRLAEAKEMVGHGGWGSYVKELGYSASTAQNLIRIYEEYGDDQLSLLGDPKSQTFGNLSYSKALALLAVPSDEREEFALEHDVEGMSTRELQAAIKERDEARKAAEQAEAEQRLAQEAREKMAQDMAMANEQVAALQRELEELRSKPVEVAVEAADPSVVEKAVAEAEEKLRKELEEAKKLAERYQTALNRAEKNEQRTRGELEKADAGRKRAEQEREQAVTEVEKLKRELRASGSKAVVSFGVHFELAQKELGAMLSCMEELAVAGDEENREKLGRAYQALLESFGNRETE